MFRPVYAAPLALLLVTACLGENDRREFIYKPAYCLAGGLANMGGEACLPEKLKENAAAVATAKLKDATAEKPSEDMRVYYTNDQRLAMSYDIARLMFAPDAALTKSSVTMSLVAADILPPYSAMDKSCGAANARKDTVAYVQKLVTDPMITRETANFLSEHYTDLQLTELYRVAKEGGSIKQVKNDAFIMPDPKNAAKSVNVKPKASHELGGIISYATSRVASRVVADRRSPITAVLAEATARRKTEAGLTEKACAPEPIPTEAAPAAPAETKE